MPKKTRREKLRAARRPLTVPTVDRGVPGPSEGITADSGPSEQVTPVAPRPRTPVAPQTFNFDYSYVYRDLRRIFVLAGTFFALLIALSFVIR
jgi:hypothetical protein